MPGKAWPIRKTECTHQGLIGLSFGPALSGFAKALICRCMVWPNIYQYQVNLASKHEIKEKMVTERQAMQAKQLVLKQELNQLRRPWWQNCLTVNSLPGVRYCFD